MGDVGERVASAEERISEFIAEQIAHSVSRTHTAVSSKLRRSPVVISRVCRAKTAESIRILHRRWSDTELDAVLDDRVGMIDLLVPDQTNEQTIGADEIYELLLTFGAAMSVGRTTTAVLFSPQILGTTGGPLAPGDVLDERSHGYGKT